MDNNQQPPVNDTPPAAAAEPNLPANAPQAASTPDMPAPQVKPSKNSPVILLVTVLVVIALAIAGYFAFLKKDTAETDKKAATDQTQPATPSAEVESAEAAIDDSLKALDNTEDFNSADISDSSLGL